MKAAKVALWPGKKIASPKNIVTFMSNTVVHYFWNAHGFFRDNFYFRSC